MRNRGKIIGKRRRRTLDKKTKKGEEGPMKRRVRSQKKFKKKGVDKRRKRILGKGEEVLGKRGKTLSERRERTQ